MGSGPEGDGIGGRSGELTPRLIRRSFCVSSGRAGDAWLTVQAATAWISNADPEWQMFAHDGIR